MRIYGKNPERKPKSKIDVYLKAIVIGVVIALLFIGGGIGLKALIKLIITYWMWILGVIFGLLFLRKFLLRRKQK